MRVCVCVASDGTQGFCSGCFVQGIDVSGSEAIKLGGNVHVHICRTDKQFFSSSKGQYKLRPAWEVPLPDPNPEFAGIVP